MRIWHGKRKHAERPIPRYHGRSREVEVRMKHPRMASLVLLVIGGLTMAAQTTPSGPTTAGPTRPNSGNGTMSRGRQQPCWEQAGVSQTVAHQRRQILLNTESQIGSV